MQTDRYSRQTLLPQFGASGQARLGGAKVVIVGAGGLGCHVAPLLVGAGVGSIVLIDHDTVSLNNLHRQTLYREQHIGQLKAEVAQAELAALNSSVSVQAQVLRCNPSNVADLINGADVVLDAADNFAVSYLLSDACRAAQVVLISASVNRTFGYVGAFCGPLKLQLPDLRSVFPRVPDAPFGCDVVGVTGPSVAVVAAVQAQETLKFLLNQTLSPTLWQLELWDYAVHAIDTSTGANANEQPTPSISFVGADAIDQQLVVDVREPSEVAEERLPFVNTVNIPLSQLTATTQIPSEREWVFACRSGQRALIAAQRVHNRNAAVSVLLPSN